MIQLSNYLRIVRASAWYDVLVTMGFATPWTFAAIHHSLASLIQTLGLPGDFPVFAPTHILMANLLGSIVTVWAILRLRDPQRVYGRYDAVARFLFAIWQLHAVTHGASVIILGFTFFELVFGIAQSLPISDHEPSTAPDPEPRTA
jgi:hypothetical protein